MVHVLYIACASSIKNPSRKEPSMGVLLEIKQQPLLLFVPYYILTILSLLVSAKSRNSLLVIFFISVKNQSLLSALLSVLAEC